MLGGLDKGGLIVYILQHFRYIDGERTSEIIVLFFIYRLSHLLLSSECGKLTLLGIHNILSHQNL